MNRETLINFIPKPNNRSVIIYDTSLKDLINVDVIDEYNNLLPTFNLYSEKYLQCSQDIEDYKKTINNIYLLKSNWSEEDYLYHLQNEKKTYANLFGPIKRIESNIEMLQKKVKTIDEKIEMQTIKEEKKIADEKSNIDKRINENVDKLMELKEKYATLKTESEQISKNIQENQEDFLILQEIVQGISKGECKCQYCGSVLSNVSENSRFYKRTYKNLARNKEELENLIKRKEKNEEELLLYSEKIKEIKQELKNDSSFKADTFNFYQKKSIAILRLEGKRDEMLNDIDKLQKELNSHSQTKSKQFLDLKNKIEKYELSLENLQKIKELKNKMQEKQNEYKEIREKFIQTKETMEQYKKFLTIFFKIYEQKANEFCGKDFKFKIFDFDGYTLVEKFEIYYRTILYENLAPIIKEDVDKTLEKKFIL